MTATSRRSFLAMGAAGFAAGNLVDGVSAAPRNQAPMPARPDILAVVVATNPDGPLIVEGGPPQSASPGKRAAMITGAGARVWNFVPPGDLGSFSPGDEIVAQGRWIDSNTFEAMDVAPLFDGIEDEIESISDGKVKTAHGETVDLSVARSTFDTAAPIGIAAEDAVGRQMILALVQRNIAAGPRRAYVAKFK